MQKWHVDNLDIPHQVDIIIIRRDRMYPNISTDGSPFDTTEGSLSLPVKIYHIGCHGGEQRLIDCEFEKYDTPYFYYNADNTVQIVSIKCDATNETVCEDCESTSDVTSSDVTSSDSQSVIVAAISIAVLCFTLLIFLVMAYIILTVIRQKKER